MPITPDQYRDHINQNQEAVIGAIDSLLTQEAAAGRTLPQCIALPAVAQQAKVAIPHVYALKEAIISVYGAHGWTVEYVSDQRDGDYFRFDAVLRL